MRVLNAKQKRLLNQWWNKSEPSQMDKQFYSKLNPLWRFEDLTLDQIKILEGLNDFEILSQEVNRFLGDLNMRPKQ